MKRLIAVGLVIMTLTGCGEQNAVPTSAPDNSKAVAAEARTYLKENFKQTFWFPLITSIQADGDQLQVKTSIYPDDDGKQSGKAIGNALMMDDHSQATSFIIYGKDGSMLDIETK